MTSPAGKTALSAGPYAAPAADRGRVSRVPWPDASPLSLGFPSFPAPYCFACRRLSGAGVRPATLQKFPRLNKVHALPIRPGPGGMALSRSQP